MIRLRIEMFSCPTRIAFGNGWLCDRIPALCTLCTRKTPESPEKTHSPLFFVRWVTVSHVIRIICNFGFLRGPHKVCVWLDCSGWYKDGDGSAMFAIRYCFYLNHRIGGRRSADGMKNERFSFASNVLVFFST